MPAQGTTTSSHPTMVYGMPPPVMIWVQINNNSNTEQQQATASHMADQVTSSLLGIPLMGFMMPGLGSSPTMEDSGVMRAIHELFMRAQTRDQGPPPTSKAFLEKIPQKTWTKQSHETEKHTDCAICLCDYEADDELLPLPCGHQFHKQCGMPWLVEHNVCPTCRYQLPTSQAAEQEKPAAAASAPSQPETSVSQPESEPQPSDSEMPARTTRVRSRTQSVDTPRIVRRRVSHTESITLPGATSAFASEQELDHMLEEEADRLVMEEQSKQRADSINFDDIDVEDLLRDTSS